MKQQFGMDEMYPVVVLESDDGLTHAAMNNGGRAVVAIRIRQVGSFQFMKGHNRL